MGARDRGGCRRAGFTPCGLCTVHSSLAVLRARWSSRQAVASVLKCASACCRSTIAHPSCSKAVWLAQACCRNARGQPWPPVPRSADAASLPITHLSPQDVPSFNDLGIARGAKLRQGYPPPFSTQWRPTVAVCALRRDGTSDAALLEWLEHHRCDRLRGDGLCSGRQCCFCQGIGHEVLRPCAALVPCAPACERDGPRQHTCKVATHVLPQCSQAPHSAHVACAGACVASPLLCTSPQSRSKKNRTR